MATLLIAVTLVLMGITDLVAIVLSTFYVFSQPSAILAGLKLIFWANLVLLLLFSIFSFYAIRSSGVHYFVWMIVCLAITLVLEGGTGLAILPFPWRYISPALSILGIVVLTEWWFKFRSLMKS